ncbi:MAG: monofunctional biosynthetic peptidoglycan transglycosylase [Burkholderiaceae bacterium]
MACVPKPNQSIGCCVRRADIVTRKKKARGRKADKKQADLFDQPARKSRGWRWLITWLLVLGAVGFLAVQAWYFARVILLVNNNPVQSAFMQARAKQLAVRRKPGVLRHRWVSYAAIAEPLKKAVLVAEDARFVEHFGIDWRAIQRAWLINLERDSISFGGSTITMQLAKNLFLSGQRSYWRKSQEVLIALMLESALSKERIFELYLNLAQWGGNVFGAQAAARYYFQVNASALTLNQASRLAAMLPRPAHYDRHRGSDWLARRAKIIAADTPNVRLPETGAW